MIGSEKANDRRKLKAKREVVGVFPEREDDVILRKKVTPGFVITQSIFFS